MANNLSLEQRKWILKKYWKYENAETVCRAWQEGFDTPPPSRLTIYRIRNKFNKTGLVVMHQNLDVLQLLRVKKIRR